MQTNNLIQKLPLLGRAIAASAPRVTIYEDPRTRARTIGSAVLIKYLATEGEYHGLELQRYLCWMPKKDAFEEHLVLAVPDGAVDEIRKAYEWVLHRAERFQAYDRAHQMHDAGPEEFVALCFIELDYLKKLRDSVDIAIQKLEKFS